LAPLRYIVSLLTVLPVGRRPIELGPGGIGRAVGLAPLVGVIVWLPAALLMYFSRVALDGGHGWIGPAIGLSAIAILTGGLHLDGLADVGDAIGSRKPAGQALAIMKDSQIGALGAVTLVFMIVTQVGALGLAVERHHGTVTLLTAQLAGRLAIVHGCVAGIPPARADGLGVRVIGTVSRLRAVVVTLLVLGVAGIAGKLDYDGGRFRESVHAVAAVLIAVFLGWALRRLLMRRFGGMTGDVFGAVVEFTALVALLVMAARPPGWLH
jgi:adenosylcobinamide-GDP ribazoletransferase